MNTYVVQDKDRLLHIALHPRGVAATRYRRQWLSDNTFTVRVVASWEVNPDLARKGRPHITKIDLCRMVSDLSGQLDNPVIRSILTHQYGKEVAHRQDSTS